MAVDAVSRESSRNVRSSQRAEQAQARKAERERRQEARRAERERQSKPVEQPPVQQQPVQQPAQQPAQQTEATQPKPEAEQSQSKNFIGDLKGARVVNFAVQGGRNSNSISVFASGQGPKARPDTAEKKSEEPKPDSSTVDVEA